MRKIWAALAAMVSVAMPGSAAHARLMYDMVETVRPATPAAPVSLRGSSLYIYSFLDIRQSEFGLKVINQVDAQLIARFGAEDVQAKVLRFRDSPMGENFSASTGYGRSSGVIPVEEVMAANRKDELAVNARYRLVVFPTNYEIAGAWQYYEIRWVLYDVQTNQRIWSYLYAGRHMMLLSPGENSAKRAKKFIDKAMAQLRGAGYL